MSHDVEKMMFTGDQAPWWYGNSSQQGAVGTFLGEDAVTSIEAMRAADLEWMAMKCQGGYQHGVTKYFNKPIWHEVEGECFLIRDRDGQFLGRCSEDYKEFQNAEAFEFLDSMVHEGQLLYHTAGSLGMGKRVWILAQTPIQWAIKKRNGQEQVHKAFVNAMLGHTGDIGISLMATDVRVVCANTAGWADERAEGENLVFRISHRGDIKKKLSLAAHGLEVMQSQAPERRAVLQALAQAAMSTEEFIDFATSIFLGLDGDNSEIEAGVAAFYETATPRSKTIMENKVALVTDKFKNGIGNDGDSMYDAMNGFTEFFDHVNLDHIKNKIEKGKRAAKAVESSWIGAGASRKALVYKRLKEKL